MKNVKEILKEVLEEARNIDRKMEMLIEKQLSDREIKERELYYEYEFYQAVDELLKDFTIVDMFEIEDFIKTLNTKAIYGAGFRTKIVLNKKIDDLYCEYQTKQTEVEKVERMFRRGRK